MGVKDLSSVSLVSLDLSSSLVGHVQSVPGVQCLSCLCNCSAVSTCCVLSGHLPAGAQVCSGGPCEGCLSFALSPDPLRQLHLGQKEWPCVCKGCGELGCCARQEIEGKAGEEPGFETPLVLGIRSPPPRLAQPEPSPSTTHHFLPQPQNPAEGQESTFPVLFPSPQSQPWGRHLVPGFLTQQLRSPVIRAALWGGTPLFVQGLDLRGPSPHDVKLALYKMRVPQLSASSS